MTDSGLRTKLLWAIIRLSIISQLQTTELVREFPFRGMSISQLSYRDKD